MKVIIVDDEECIRDSIRWHLEDQGHEVLSFSDPTQVDLEKICKESSNCPCHILFTDFMMPKMNGVQFLRNIHNMGCKVGFSNKYLMTSYGHVVSGDEVEQVGCQVISKPISLGQIDSLIEESKNRTFSSVA